MMNRKFIGFLVLAFIIFLWACSNIAKKSNKFQAVESVDEGPGYKVNPGYMQNFYRVYGDALHKMVDDHDYNAAEILLKEALKYAEVQPESAMVHHELSKIYRERNDYANELESQRAVAKYTMNHDERAKCNHRIEELMMIINSKPDAAHKKVPPTQETG